MTAPAGSRYGSHRLFAWRKPFAILACLLSLCAVLQGNASAQATACEPSGASEPSGDLPAARVDAESLRLEKAAIARHLVFRFHLKPKLAMRIVDAVYCEAQSHGLPPSLVLAIIAAESSFDPGATSPAGARGLMQVLPRYHRPLLKQFAPDANLYFPENNIRIGTAILQHYLSIAAGDIDAALSNYSGGSPGYAVRVHTRWQEFSGLTSAPALEPLAMLIGQTR